MLHSEFSICLLCLETPVFKTESMYLQGGKTIVVPLNLTMTNKEIDEFEVVRSLSTSFFLNRIFFWVASVTGCRQGRRNRKYVVKAYA